MRDWTTALRGDDAVALDALYDAMRASIREDGRANGRTVFVGRDDAAGRQDLLVAWAAVLGSSRPRPAVVGGRLDGERYVPWEQDAQAAAGKLTALRGALAAAGAATAPASVLSRELQTEAPSERPKRLLARCRVAPSVRGLTTCRRRPGVASAG